MSDTNLHSFVGPDWDNQTVELGDVAPDPAAGIASPIKITQHVNGLTVSAGRVDGGHDACVDVNNEASNVSTDIAEAHPHGQFVATTKGGAKNVHHYFQRIVGHGTVCDFIFDDYSDQSHLATKGCSLDAKMDDGSAVRVIALKTMPHLAPGSGPYSFPWWQPLNLRVPFTENYYTIGFIFDTLRRWGFFRAQSNNQNTQP